MSLTGFYRSDWSTWAERWGGDDARRAWSRGRQGLDLIYTWKRDALRVRLHGHGEYDLRYLGDDLHDIDADLPGATDDFDDATARVHGRQLVPREALAALSLGAVEVTVGRQIVAWGEGDALSPLDVVNPRDLREPGMADLDDLRMSVLATRVGVFFDDHRVEAMVIHEADFGLRSPPFGPYSPFPSLVGAAGSSDAAAFLSGKSFRYRHAEARFALDQQQPMLRWVYKGPGVDLGLYAAYVMDRQGVVELPETSALGASDTVEVTLRHPAYALLGTSGAWAWDALLVKWELAAALDRSYTTGNGEAFPPALGVDQGSAVDVMVGITWSPDTTTQLALEGARSTFVDAPAGLQFPADLPQVAFRISKRLLRERLVLLGALSVIGLEADERGFLGRVQANYEMADGLSGTVGFVHYDPSADLGPLSGLGEHDQVFVSGRWDFALL